MSDPHKDCESWRDQIKNLKALHADYTNEYNQHLQIGDFSGFNKQKEKLKTAINKLADEIPSEPRLRKRIASLHLTKEEKQKLLDLINPDHYIEAVETAMELDLSIKVPSWNDILTSIYRLGRDKLMSIAKLMGKPDLIISPDKSFEQLIKQMNANPHFQDQRPIQVDDEHGNIPTPERVNVHIVDTIQHAPEIPGQFDDNNDYGIQLKICKNFLEGRGLQMVDQYTYACAVQKCLRQYAMRKALERNPIRHIMDYRTRKTIRTFFWDKRALEKGQILDSSFESIDRGQFFSFESRNHDEGEKIYRARAMQPLKIKQSASPGELNNE